MKILKISSENKYFEDVVGLYEAAFPADERREVAEFPGLPTRKRSSTSMCLSETMTNLLVF